MADALQLILETSTPTGSLVLAGGDRCLAKRDFASDRSHNAMLFGPLAELMALRDGRPLDLVLVGSGPGSYSGTRVGIAAAQGVAIACGCGAVAVPSILAVPCVAGGGSCLAIGDARRGSYWTARIDHLRPEGPPELTDAEGLAARVTAALDGGADVFSFEEPARFPLEEGLQARILKQVPDAERLWHVWCQSAADQKADWAAMPPQPLYLKPPHITPGKKTVWF
jgi:tRNA threonylcarbamoyladenosine biosynthesis protein TsaB